ncbi:class I SAM-dependent methyltransferase [Crocinitomicaceae bacterium]|nr:class I SAM-dependent methyltransferase [Crocinitomicaceae bacterium]
MSQAFNQVTYLTAPDNAFETQYKSVRDKEGRWLSDEAVKQLPQVNRNDQKSEEWKKRAWMLNKFETYVSLASTNNVLDIGCGNGWMTNHISNHSETITGVDVGTEELEQAARCFGNENVRFACTTDWSLLPKASYNLIYFAGSFHYFDPDESFWELLFSMLAPEGEIHILETQFYEKSEVDAAKQRSKEYFKKMGESIEYYKHLAWDVLPEKYEVLYRPDFKNKIFKSRSPFPWIRIRK